MPLWLRVWKEDDLGPLCDTLRRLMLDRTIEGVPSIVQHARPRLGDVAAKPVVRGRRPDPGADHRPDRARARDRALEHAARALRRRGGRRPEARRRSRRRRPDPRCGRPGREVRVRGHPEPSASRRPHRGRRPEPRVELHDRLVRRRGGRPHRLLAGRPADRHRGAQAAPAAPRARRGAGEARLHGRHPRHQRPQLHQRRHGHLRHEGRGAGRAAPTTRPGCSCRRRPRRASASTAPTSTSWISRPTSTASATTPTGASARRSRTRSTRTASSRPASRASGRSRCGTAAPSRDEAPYGSNAERRGRIYPAPTGR